jgi:hypothetical protein
MNIKVHVKQREEHKVHRKITGPKMVEVANLGYYIMRSFIIWTGYLVLLGP